MRRQMQPTLNFLGVDVRAVSVTGRVSEARRHLRIVSCRHGVGIGIDAAKHTGVDVDGDVTGKNKYAEILCGNSSPALLGLKPRQCHSLTPPLMRGPSRRRAPCPLSRSAASTTKSSRFFPLRFEKEDTGRCVTDRDASESRRQTLTSLNRSIQKLNDLGRLSIKKL